MTWQRNPQFLTPKEAVKKIEKYCAYQERSQRQVIDKLKSWGLTESERGEILVHLIQSNFLNEERFAIAYAKGKYKIKKWGPDKIKRGLIQAGVSSQLVNLALGEIPVEDIQNQIRTLGLKKLKLPIDTKGYINLEWDVRNKLYRYLLGKGYSIEEINHAFPR